MRNLTLLTDFYELTMMYGYFKEGKKDQIATFDLFFRPFDESNFCIVAGIEQAVEYLQNLRFTDEDIDYILTKLPPIVERLREMSPLYHK